MNGRIRKRIFYSLMVMLVWLGFVVEGSHALLTSMAILTGNSVSSGTAELKISSSQSSPPTTFSDSATGFAYNLVPGQSAEYYFTLENASPEDISLDTMVSVNYSDQIASIYNASTLEIVPVDNTGAPQGSGMSGTLDVLRNTQTSLGSTIAAGSAQRYKAKVTLDQSYTTGNDSSNFDLYFTGVQHNVP
ncbi:hypothetical protein KGQ71_03685 [Patescibacteria group bacterium]|nr:hypothetical protein [Patescibacteria group bacterium]